MHDTFKALVEKSDRILITSHISPDPDAIASILLMGRSLVLNSTDNKVMIALEEQPSQDVSFLPGYRDITYGPILRIIEAFGPDLLVILDASSIARITRDDTTAASDLVYKQLKASVIVIDHHEKDATTKAELYIKSSRPATAQAVYELLFDDLKFKKPDGYAETTLLGIVRDTARFKYDNPDHKETFKVVSQLLDAGASIEQLEYELDRYKKDELTVLSNLLSNTVATSEGYTFSFIDDDFAKEWQAKNSPIDAYKAACDTFSGQFLRNVERNFWGFVVYPEPMAKDKSYSVSFRSVSGSVDVAAIAAKLGGGGHKEAAGAKNIKAENINAAIDTVKRALSSNN